MVRTATLTTFEFANEEGILATVGAALAVEDVDVLGFTVCAHESLKSLHLVTEDQAPSLATLDDAGLTRRTRQALVVGLTGGPRELGEVGRRLADADVNVETSLSLRQGPTTEVALAVDEPNRARKLLAAEEAVRPAP